MSEQVPEPTDDAVAAVLGEDIEADINENDGKGAEAGGPPEGHPLWR